MESNLSADGFSLLIFFVAAAIIVGISKQGMRCSLNISEFQLWSRPNIYRLRVYACCVSKLQLCIFHFGRPPSVFLSLCLSLSSPPERRSCLHTIFGSYRLLVYAHFSFTRMRFPIPPSLCARLSSLAWHYLSVSINKQMLTTVAARQIACSTTVRILTKVQRPKQITGGISSQHCMTRVQSAQERVRAILLLLLLVTVHSIVCDCMHNATSILRNVVEIWPHVRSARTCFSLLLPKFYIACLKYTSRCLSTLARLFHSS